MTEESDHVALIVRAMEAPATIANRGPPPFRYEQMWTKHPTYDQMVLEAWSRADDGEQGPVVCAADCDE